VEVQSNKELMQAVKLAYHFRLPYKVLGAGSGVLISDVGFPGLIIINRTTGLAFNDQNGQVIVEAGLDTNQLVNLAAARGLGGLEFLAEVPGSVGGALITNATVGNAQLGSCVREATVFTVNQPGNEIANIPTAGFGFRPYYSNFLDQQIRVLEAGPVVLTIRLQLTKLPEDEIRRRLLLRRRVGSRPEQKSALGFPFTQSLASLTNQGQLRKLRSRNLRINRQKIDIIENRSAKTLASELRSFISELAAQAESQSRSAIGQRIDYLGYWPDDSS
jgi:UDP-N-acetylenolpyruvoylglucosamine reductase